METGLLKERTLLMMGSKKFKCNSKLFVYEMGEDIAVYNGLFCRKMYLGRRYRDLFDRFKNPQNWQDISLFVERHPSERRNEYYRLLNSLLDQQFVIPSQFSESTYMKRLKENCVSPITLGTLYFIMTNACNMACKYCVIRHNAKMSNERLTRSTIDRVMVFARNNFITPFKPLDITFYGGEPLLRFDEIRRVVDKFETRYVQGWYGTKRPNYSISTNGVLLNDEILDFVKDRFISLTISVDGLRQRNDSVRVLQNGGGTYEIVTRNIEKLIRLKIPHTLSCTVGTHNIDQLSGDIRSLHAKFGFKRFILCLMHEYRRSPERALIGGNNYVVNGERLMKGLSDLYEWCDANNVEEDTLTRRWDAFVNDRPQLFWCAAYDGEIAVAPNGRIAPCPASLGDRTQSIPIDSCYQSKMEAIPLFRRWNKRSTLSMPQCKECTYALSCTGGCAYDALSKCGSINTADPLFCKYTEMTLKRYLKRYYRTFMMKPSKSGTPHDSDTWKTC